MLHYGIITTASTGTTHASRMLSVARGPPREGSFTCSTDGASAAAVGARAEEEEERSEEEVGVEEADEGEGTEEEAKGGEEHDRGEEEEGARRGGGEGARENRDANRGERVVKPLG